ncbi:MAG: hypothetical protein H6767_07775 [Candidatus Peribacteria bacterium]|nr:MAG: hypothetical protein H6767_07775 [Candidatus Peribacteria bacterium]
MYDAMLEYYKTLAKDKGGSFPFNYVDAWAVLFPDGSIKDFEYERHYIMTDTPHGPKQLYFPMCNLYRSMITGKYFTDWDEHDFYKEFAHQREGLKYVLDL